MVSLEEYQLLDFGQGRKLEKFGPYILDRASPAADNLARTDPRLWKTASAVYHRRDGTDGKWSWRGESTDAWTLDLQCFRMSLKCTSFGHIGIFPEQMKNWQWIFDRCQRGERPVRVLNLFAYTGASTLAAAAAGAEVTHVDSAKNVVQWARANADVSGLQDAPIRWIVEDAAKFVRREVKRGRKYDAVILDPPSYGHGPKGEVWKVSHHLPELLQNCATLLANHARFILLTCHSPGFGPAELSASVTDAFFGSCQAPVVTNRLTIPCQDGRKLDAGVVVRWP